MTIVRTTTLPGGARVDVLADGSGIVRDPLGRAVTTLPAHTVTTL
jgi:hypothetical protein